MLWDLEQHDTFSFRDSNQGLNLDFMTYSMYAMANKDPTALLDASTMQRHAEKTFSTFFQHFVSSNLSATTPSWAYQEINASLPYGINSTYKWIPDEGYQSFPLPPQPPSNTNRTALVEVSTQVELLRMNAVAVWLSVAILAWLIFTTVAIAVLQRKYLRNLDRNIECLGDVLVLVAHSDRLLQLVRERGPDGLEKERDVKTKLGWFEDNDGEQRWGIEVVEEDE
ncbi:hypothetical protein DBV05_g12508 [Lasiodiplodia theobromae]|uniref:Uncharacterized protein n=1 Tax=Lasiodiplodia theobromae TaxID=45133 RepID=A0A5N5CTZ5_9PEZI|nr:hypothetical protein DBV05_g12508 [Lasiodiplodia theobromae]